LWSVYSFFVKNLDEAGQKAPTRWSFRMLRGQP
jgi:hypothetical protein